MLALLFVACSSSAPPSPAPETGAPTAAPDPAPITAAPPGSATVAPEAPAPAAPSISSAEARELLFPDGTSAPADDACPGDDAERIRCWIRARFAADEGAAGDAIGMFDSTGDVNGVEREQVVNGGFRGTIQLVPEPPVGRYRKHLSWLAAARRDHAQFFEGLAARSKAPIAYRFRAIGFKWFRSVDRTTPSAYAEGWTVAWNVSGSLHKNADKVRETLFHEVFHLNDFDHDDWSRRALSSLHAELLARCGTSRACLRPFAPSETTVRGGTYYAFQPNNGDSFHEYAAELGLRYYRENRAILRGESVAAPFKCGPEPNARAWSLLADEFFGGIDLVPSCR